MVITLRPSVVTFGGLCGLFSLVFTVKSIQSAQPVVPFPPRKIRCHEKILSVFAVPAVALPLFCGVAGVRRGLYCDSFHAPCVGGVRIFPLDLLARRLRRTFQHQIL